jgi:hypothetical protein
MSWYIGEYPTSSWLAFAFWQLDIYVMMPIWFLFVILSFVWATCNCLSANDSLPPIYLTTWNGWKFLYLLERDSTSSVSCMSMCSVVGILSCYSHLKCFLTSCALCAPSWLSIDFKVSCVLPALSCLTWATPLSF